MQLRAVQPPPQAWHAPASFALSPALAAGLPVPLSQGAAAPNAWAGAKRARAAQMPRPASGRPRACWLGGVSNRRSSLAPDRTHGQTCTAPRLLPRCPCLPPFRPSVVLPLPRLHAFDRVRAWAGGAAAAGRRKSNSGHAVETRAWPRWDGPIGSREVLRPPATFATLPPPHPSQGGAANPTAVCTLQRSTRPSRQLVLLSCSLSWFMQLWTAARQWARASSSTSAMSAKPELLAAPAEAQPPQPPPQRSPIPLAENCKSRLKELFDHHSHWEWACGNLVYRCEPLVTAAASDPMAMQWTCRWGGRAGCGWCACVQVLRRRPSVV